MITKNIISLGGGGFSMESENPALDLYILSQARRKHPKVCFLPTASGDAAGYIEKFYNSFRDHDCTPVHLSLFSPPVGDLQNFILDCDVIYVGGGNTRNMLVLWKEWGLDRFLRAAWEQGVVLCGISAGAICWFEQGQTDSNPGTLSRLDCLGFLPGSCSPHFDGEPERRPDFLRKIQSGEMKTGYGIDDSVGLHFVDLELRRIVRSKPGPKAYFIEGSDQVKTLDPIDL